MAREIKFRAWHKNLKKILGEWDWAHYGPSFIKGEITSDDHIIMQYTGLKDKNGKEIYDGDIVSWEQERLVNMGEDILHEHGKGKIIWAQEFCHFGIEEIPKELGHWTFSEDARYQVIGNIHENPELLK